MKKLFRVDVYSFNILLAIIVPMVLGLFIFNYQNNPSAFSHSWLFTVDFLKFIMILLSYSLPLVFFCSKIYQLLKQPDASQLKQLGLIATSLLFLPFGVILLFVIAKINFLGVMALAVGIFIAYVSSYKLKPALIKA